MSTLCDKFWLCMRRNNCAYVTNKVLSFMVAAALAAMTAMHKPLLQKYTYEKWQMDNVNTYNYIFWLLFVYYSFAAMDELVELYAVMSDRQKGSIGLLFELNTLMGVGIMTYIGYFKYSQKMAVQTEYKALETWIDYQIYLFYAMLGLSFLICCCCGCMQRSFTRRDVSSKVSGGYNKASALDDDE